MANIPGVSGVVTPDVYSTVTTIAGSSSTPGGQRLPAIMGEGATSEVLVSSANGGGQDGVNPTYTGVVGQDGRHFTTSFSNLVPNRSSVLLNGIPLSGIEQPISAAAFDSRYDYRIDPITGHIELQRAYIQDQGGSFFVPGSSNVGNGTLATLSLIDADAPTELWTLRVTSVLKDAYGDPISGNAIFTIVGSVSGQLNDAYGNPVIAVSNGTVVNNTILQLSIAEGSTPFNLGDRFSIKVSSRVLQKGDKLGATYIAFANLYDPQFFTDPNALFQKHGYPSVDNTLSLAAQMAFENGAFGLYAVQAMPALPRKTLEAPVLVDNPLESTTGGFSGGTDEQSLTLPLLLGEPDINTQVEIFIIDGQSGNKTQIFPTKVPFYSPTITANPYSAFINNPTLYNFSYTVILESEVEQDGIDGYAASGSAVFSAPSANFSAFNLNAGEEDTFKQIRIMPYDNMGNAVADAGIYDILSVGGGDYDQHSVTLDYTFTATNSNFLWELVNPGVQGASVLLTKDLVTSGTIAKRDGIEVSYVEINDATFFDQDWEQGYMALEQIQCQMVVPVPSEDFANIQQAGKAHVENMSSTLIKQERLLFTGAQSGLTPDAVLGNILVEVDEEGNVISTTNTGTTTTVYEDLVNFDVSTAFGDSFRVMYFYPDQITRVINGTSTTLPGFYMGAAAAGFFASRPDYAIPLTRKVLTGFSIDRSRVFRPLINNSLVAGGIALVAPVTGGGQVIWGLTTTNSGSPVEQEASVVFIRDRVAQVLRATMQQFIGTVADNTIVASITSAATTALTGLVSAGLLTTYQNLSITRDTVDPRQFDVAVEILPVLPVDFVYINISVTT